MFSKFSFFFFLLNRSHNDIKNACILSRHEKKKFMHLSVEMDQCQTYITTRLPVTCWVKLSLNFELLNFLNQLY